MKKYYPLAQEIYYKEWLKAGKPKHPFKIMGKLAGEFRNPRKGEYYLSGAIPEVYDSPNDLSTPFHIIKLVKVKEMTDYIKVKEITTNG